MRIVFSRKGFDSSAGGFPSLIFPDGTLFSIPIPSSRDDCYYSDLSFEYGCESIQTILNQVTGGRIYVNKQWKSCDYSQATQRCHHDPQQVKELNSLALGQTGRSEAHLRKCEIETGDIFLFYGWFKQVEHFNGRWRFALDAKDIHLIWSWMRVGRTIELESPEQRMSALSDFPQLNIHPHMAHWRTSPNRIYLSKESSLLPYSDNRCLTDRNDYRGRSTWRLAACFNQPQAFTYLKTFIPESNEVVIQYRGYGQEFVLDLDNVASDSERAEIARSIDRILE